MGLNRKPFSQENPFKLSRLDNIFIAITFLSLGVVLNPNSSELQNIIAKDLLLSGLVGGYLGVKTLKIAEAISSKRRLEIDQGSAVIERGSLQKVIIAGSGHRTVTDLMKQRDAILPIMKNEASAHDILEAAIAIGSILPRKDKKKWMQAAKYINLDLIRGEAITETQEEIATRLWKMVAENFIKTKDEKRIFVTYSLEGDVLDSLIQRDNTNTGADIYESLAVHRIFSKNAIEQNLCKNDIHVRISPSHIPSDVEGKDFGVITSTTNRHNFEATPRAGEINYKDSERQLVWIDPGALIMSAIIRESKDIPLGVNIKQGFELFSLVKELKDLPLIKLFGLIRSQGLKSDLNEKINRGMVVVIGNNDDQTLVKVRYLKKNDKSRSKKRIIAIVNSVNAAESIEDEFPDVKAISLSRETSRVISEITEKIRQGESAGAIQKHYDTELHHKDCQQIALKIAPTNA